MLSFPRVVSGAIGSSRILSGSLFTASFPQYLRSDTPNSNNRNCRTVAVATLSSVDLKLVTALKSEIKSQRLSIEQTMPAAPADFPFTIDIDEAKEEGELTAEVNREKIFVSIAMPETIVEDLRISPDDSPDSDVCLPGMLDLYVRIGKQNGKLVEFGVSLCPHAMHVKSIRESADDEYEHDDEYEYDVDEEGELQTTLQEYLKMREIKTCYAEFMYKYMAWKSKQSRLNYLTTLNKFIKD